jgi:hypothetical protein
VFIAVRYLGRYVGRGLRDVSAGRVSPLRASRVGRLRKSARKAPAVALSAAQVQRNKVAILTRHHPDSPQLVDARRDLAASKLAGYIERVVAAAPPLTNAQRDRLALLLRGGDAS